MTLFALERWVRRTMLAVCVLAAVQIASLVMMIDISCGPCAVVVGSLCHQVVLAPRLPIEWEFRVAALTPSEHTVLQLVPRLEASIYGGLYVLHVPQVVVIGCALLSNLFFRRARSIKRRSDRCPRCDYQLKQARSCPECGHECGAAAVGRG